MRRGLKRGPSWAQEHHGGTPPRSPPLRRGPDSSPARPSARVPASPRPPSRAGGTVGSPRTGSGGGAKAEGGDGGPGRRAPHSLRPDAGPGRAQAERSGRTRRREDRDQQVECRRWGHSVTRASGGKHLSTVGHQEPWSITPGTYDRSIALPHSGLEYTSVISPPQAVAAN
ncbi:hypothetical protein U0070_026406 [Myodes glareolus]|uniref:Uncharacterized protein n=1 Tax=Myodes glareolus TaxID=447135 RepID=A0AAW0IJY3_MYOGA